MSNGYIQPYESLNSTAKLIKLPINHRSTSVGRNLWTRMLSRGHLSQNTTGNENPPKKSESPSQTSCRSLDLNSTTIAQDKINVSPRPSMRNSRSSSRSSQGSSIAPEPAPRHSISRNSFSDSEKSSTTNSRNSIIRANNPSLRTRTTVTVHLSKSSKTNSTPNLLEDHNSLESKTFEPNIKNINIPLSRSMANINNSSLSQNNLQDLRNSSNHRRTVHSIKLDNNRTNNRNFISSENNRANERILFPVQHRTNGFVTAKNIPSSAIPQNENFLSFTSSRSDLEEETELNSLQVFRQPKYKDRNKAARRIKQLEHLKQNESCNELVNQLGKGIQPNTYENQHSLKSVDFINKKGFITTSRNVSPVVNSSPKKPVPRPINFNKIRRDHVYSEIGEQQLDTARVPSFRKNVTFSTTHDPIQERDALSPNNKKILPAKFWGIVQVTQALRSKSDEERRKIASLCYQAILTGTNHFSKFFGKVDNSRWGEVAYVLLMANSFEVRDSEGFLVAKHDFTDVSVLFQPEDDPNILVYIGRCKFSGRVGIALRMNKMKGAEYILNAFKNNK